MAKKSKTNRARSGKAASSKRSPRRSGSTPAGRTRREHQAGGYDHRGGEADEDRNP